MLGMWKYLSRFGENLRLWVVVFNFFGYSIGRIVNVFEKVGIGYDVIVNIVVVVNIIKKLSSCLGGWVL